MAGRVDIGGALRKMQALAIVLQRPLRDVLDSGARVCAISLAKTTQPNGTGIDAKTKGENAVARDILRVYGSAGGAFERIVGERSKGIFWAKYKKGDFEGATDFARTAGVIVGDFDGGAAHKSERRTTRPVILTKKPKLYIIKPSERKRLERYIQFVQRDVGTAKGAWADVARQISGSIRGLRTEGDITANWITRKGKGSGAAVRSGTDFDPKIRITNRIDYIDQLLSQSSRRYAEDIAHHRMITNLEFAVKAQAKKLR